VAVESIPVVRVDEVFHVGALNAALRGACGDSQEGSCLSVSLCPQAWTEIARLGGSPTWRLTRRGAVFLDIHRAMADPQLLAAVLEWGRNEGLCAPAQRFRSYQWDSDFDDWRYMLCTTHEEALNEIVDETDSWETDGPGGGPLVREVTVNRGTTALSALVGVSERQLDDCDDLVLMAWAMKTVGPVDGVWWTETYDPQGLSAPRGGIFPEAVIGWRSEATDAHERDDLDLLESADYEATLAVFATGAAAVANS